MTVMARFAQEIWGLVQGTFAFAAGVLLSFDDRHGGPWSVGRPELLLIRLFQDRKSTQLILANIKDQLMHQYLEDASLLA